MISVILVLPVLAAAPTDADSLGAGLGTGWSDSDYGYPTGWNGSWFWLAFQKLRSLVTFNSSLSSGWSDSSSGYPTGWSNSWFWRVFEKLRGISSSLSTVSSSLSSVSSSITSLNSGWYDNSVGYPTGFNNSWYWRVFDKLRGVYTTVSSLDTTFSSLKTGWFDSSTGYPTGWNNSWFWRVFDKISGLDVTNDGLLTGWSLNSSGGITHPLLFSGSWYSLLLSEIRQVENISTGLLSGWGYSSTTVTSPYDYRASWFYYLLNSSKDSAYSLSDLKSISSVISGDIITIKGYISSLKDFFASPVDVALKQQSEGTVATVTQEYFSGDGGSETSIKASNSELGDFKGVGKLLRSFKPDVSISSLSDLFDPDHDEFGLFSWLSQENAEALNPLYSTRRSMSKSSSFEPIVTDYYQENLDLISSWERDHS